MEVTWNITHSHVTGEVIGYAHKFCNKKIRENHNIVPVFVHNLFSFDFFFVLKGIRLCIWRTKQLNIWSTNLTIIGNQVKFIDTMKYYQQSLSSLVKNASKLEKKYIRNSCLKFIQNNETYWGQFNSSFDDEKKLGVTLFVWR